MLVVAFEGGPVALPCFPRVVPPLEATLVVPWVAVEVVVEVVV